MSTIEKIHHHLQNLPEPLRAEVLDFVRYLTTKAERETARKESGDWSSLSLTLAMRDMEDEDTSIYTLEDLKEKFR